MAKDVQLTVDCGDCDFYFRYGRRLTLSEVEAIFASRIKEWSAKTFPGLRLKDDRGLVWKPELRVELVPAKEKTDAEQDHPSDVGR